MQGLPVRLGRENAENRTKANPEGGDLIAWQISKKYITKTVNQI